MSEIDREIGDIDEFDGQTKICKKLHLPIVGPVFKSWRPSLRVHSKTKASKNLNNVSSYTLIKEIISFIDLYELVTVRQIYYGLVSKQVISNKQQEYKRIARIVKKARLAGLIPFDKVIDDTVKLKRPLLGIL